MVTTSANEKPETHRSCVAVNLSGSLLNDIHICTAWDCNGKKPISGAALEYARIKKFALERKSRYLQLKSDRLHSQMLLNELGI